MINRPEYLKRLEAALNRSPVAALLGPRQCGKTTLARMFSEGRRTTYFDLESQVDVRRLQNPSLALGPLEGTVVIDKIQAMPELFNVLRVLVDRPENRARFLVLGSASPTVVRNVSETLAGRVEFIELAGFDLAEVGVDSWERLWLRGGFPRSFLARSEADSVAWRENFVQTFLARDIPQLGISIPAVAMRRFWTMLAHFHGQTWNASRIARSMALSDKTVRSYLDLLTGTFILRQLQPWYENVGKRQVKAPKVYLRDSGVLHSLLSITDRKSLLGHPQAGASWEGFALEQTLRTLRPGEAYFWATHSGAELDLFFLSHGRRYGIEVKFVEAPAETRSMSSALESLRLDHLWIIYPGQHAYPIHDKLTAWPLREIPSLPEQLA